MANNKRKKSGSGGGVAGGGWEIIYSGFVLIMLCFFIMLCSFSTMETSKVTRFVKSFSIAVSVFSGGLKFDKGEIVLPVSADIVDADSKIANIFTEMAEVMKSYGIEGEVGMQNIQGGLVIRLSDSILFDSGGATINENALPILNHIGTILAKSNYNIRIEGHTDNIPINTYAFPSNWELSTTRAISVLRFFIDKNHISPDRLSAEGFGEYKPLASNDSSENKAKNRRVDIKIFTGERKTKVKEIAD
ncbi:MAG: OmpA family protein [Desulfobacteraceae bacterium]|nr:OmpA family protein [Desulfobacteraceae bacterium]